jgi:hypothetical protein
METQAITEEWKILLKFLPRGWEERAFELGALTRRRKISDPETLLRVLLIHLADGKSLRTTSAYAEETGVCSVNDVSLIHRLRSSSRWFRWMAVELFKELKGDWISPHLINKYRIRLVDGTVVCEPGSTGTDWRIHYSFLLNGFHCDFFNITSPKVAETLQRYPVEKDDLLIGDRVYCHRYGIKHVLSHGGHVLLRFHSTNLPLYKRNGKPFPVLKHLRTLGETDAGDWDVWFKDPDNGQLVKGRICSLRKSKEAIEKDKKNIRKYASKKQKKLKPETLEFAEYHTIFTTVNRHNFNKEELLLLYRGRWQVELVFKRLKGIVGIGSLPKTNEDSCIAWLYGKLLLAMLVERLYQEAEFFSPWGYPL